MTPVRWLLARAEEMPPGDGWLDPRERAVLGRLRFPARRESFRLGRWTAKRAVAAWLGRAPDLAGLARIGVLAAADGAPEAFLDGRPLAVALSLTHRGGRAACALALPGTALGCDLEIVEPRSDELVRQWFTAAERGLLDAAPAADRPLLANLVWSAKESALKLLRTGLRLDARRVEVEVPDIAGGGAGGWRPLAVRWRDEGMTFRGWWRREGDALLTLAALPEPAVPGPLHERAQLRS